MNCAQNLRNDNLISHLNKDDEFKIQMDLIEKKVENLDEYSHERSLKDQNNDKIQILNINENQKELKKIMTQTPNRENAEEQKGKKIELPDKNKILEKEEKLPIQLKEKSIKVKFDINSGLPIKVKNEKEAKRMTSIRIVESKDVEKDYKKMRTDPKKKKLSDSFSDEEIKIFDQKMIGKEST